MRTDELDFELPEERIAREPASPRDSARLLVVSRSDESLMHHRLVRDLPGFLRAGDALVFNTTRVIQARFAGQNLTTGGRVTGLYLGEGPEEGCWRVLLKMRRHRPGVRVGLDLKPGQNASDSEPVELELIRRETEDGEWLVRVTGGPGALDRAGLPPLPPYILAARRHAGESENRAEDAGVYQTVYAEEPGSVAAPTAGLHFTPGLLEALRERGVRREDVTLHVGRGTFQPVEAAVVEDHPMHSERCRVEPGVLARLRAARASGGRVIPVGSTSCRTIESFAARGVDSGLLETDILIAPGYAWRMSDGLMTNFHLPRSTLIAMVAALFPGGAARVREIYDEAIRREYRFFSFGDAMLILP